MRLTLAAAIFAAFTSPVLAETYQLSFGGGTIGSLTFDGNSISSDVSSAPMGVGNGRFKATVANVRRTNGDQVVQYLSDAPAKGRRISVLFKDSAVVETTVSPTSDATDLSDISNVPAGVVTPVAAFGKLAQASGCPSAFRFYDGRRAIQIQPNGQSQDDAALTCNMTYRVTHGPGHLSPLYIKNASMSATYDVSAGQRLTSLSISSGPFTLYVTR